MSRVRNNLELNLEDQGTSVAIHEMTCRQNEESISHM
jgi:hypothetical protein